MLAVVLLATLLVVGEGNRPPLIQDDLQNEVNWSTNHDYEVHDHDADQENRPDDGQRYPTILVPTVAQEDVRDHQTQRLIDHGKNQVSVEVNGDSGLVDHSVHTAIPVVVYEGEILYHGDFDKTQTKPITIQNANNYNDNVEINKTFVAITPIVPSTALSYEETQDNISDSEEEGDRVSEEEEEAVGDGGITFEESEEEGILENSDESNEDSDSSRESHPSTNLEVVNNTTNTFSEIILSADDNESISSNRTDPKHTFTEENLLKEEEQLSNKPFSEQELSFTTTSQTIIIQDEEEHDQEQHPSSTAVSDAPLVKVQFLKKALNEKVNKGNGILHTQHFRKAKPNSLEDSPITHVGKVSKELNVPELDGEHVILKPTRRRVLIDIKKKALSKLKVEDSVVSSTTESLSSAENEGDLEHDLEESPQEEIIDSDPAVPQEPFQENHPHDPSIISGVIPESVEGIPVIPIPPPFPVEYPGKRHQPILHHIVHAIFRPPTPDDDYPEDAFLQRYSPNFVPYPAYLAIPY